MQLTSKQILGALQVLTWIAFIGLCIETGAILITTSISLFFHPEADADLYLGLDLSALLHYSRWYYVQVTSLIIALYALKAYMVFHLIQILQQINLVHPFSQTIAHLISRLSRIAIGTAVLSFIANGTVDWLQKHVVELPNLNEHIGDGAAYLFFAGIVYILAQVFNRGMEIQSENELTV